jgi:hypothetical protein
MADLQELTEQEDKPSRVVSQPDRPYIPGYGIPKGNKGTLPWSHVVERMEKAQNYWVGTVGPEGQPHAVPVWGAWVNGVLYFGGGPRTTRNLAANPAVVVHLESGSDVVILEGMAELVPDPDPSLIKQVDDALDAKYGYRSGSLGYALRPRVVYAWKNFPADATRWRFVEQ